MRPPESTPADAGAAARPDPLPGGLRAAAFVPAFLLLLTAGSTGNLAAPLRPILVTVGQLLPLAVLVFARSADLRDPLRLGSRRLWLPAIVAVTALASWFLSPVGRAGRELLVAAPALVLAVPVIGRWWTGTADRRRGTLAVSAVVAVVALWSLVGVIAFGTPGASLPLGHHNPLAAWLVLLLPLAGAPLLDGGRRLPARLVAGSALLLGLAAILASRSLSGLLGLAVAAAVMLLPLAVGRRRRAAGAVLLLAAVVEVGLPRFRTLASGEDSSALARLGYLEGALAGVVERPLLGSGPGSFPWTAGQWIRPEPGIHPPDEIVGHPHSLVVRLGYELGLLGLGAVLATCGGWVLSRKRRAGAGSVVARAASAGLAGGATLALVGLDEGLAATWWAVAVLAAAALAVEERGSGEPEPRSSAGLLLAFAGLLALAPGRWAAHLDALAVRSGTPADRVALWRTATDLDPDFPLYRFRRALELEELEQWGEARAEALEAAEDAPGLAPLWLVAGRMTGEVGHLERACDLSPFSALAPLFLARRAPDRADDLLARALLADPRMLGAADVGPESWGRALARLGELEPVPAGWREAMAAVAADSRRSGERSQLVLEADAAPAESLALVAFRRLPRHRAIATLAVDPKTFGAVELPAAASLRETPAAVFAPGCRLPEARDG